MNERSFIVKYLCSTTLDFSSLFQWAATSSCISECASHASTGLSLAVPCSNRPPPSRGYGVPSRPVPTKLPTAFSRLTRRCFHGVLRHHWHRLRGRSEAFIRNRRRLADKLPNRCQC